MFNIKVRTYYNIHQNVFSIQDFKTSRVIDRAKDVFLTHPSFVIRQSGRKRVLTEGRKNVHAFVVGYRPSEITTEEWDDYYKVGHTWKDVTYNPYKNDTFVWKDTGDPVSEESITMVKLTIPRGGRPRVQAYS